MDKDKEKRLDELLSKIVKENIDSIMADRFSRYSKYIIQERALPDVRDGLKPVQRRILYSMFGLGLNFNKPFKKSAKVVGDVLGRFHPHGDSSIYEAMVRMAQEWKMGYCLLEIHGNAGSIDDDPPAAMRYTEARLAEISNLLLDDLKKNTVKFAPNFDDSEKEPIVLPALIPNLLINGAKGIASGYATEMPPHNLGEVLDAAIAKIKNPDIQLSKLFKYVKGPDFPTGGVIYGQQGILQAFERGQGRITLVSKYHTWEDNKNKYIEITEIPYGVVKSKLVHDIDLIILNEGINGLLEVKDQSDRQGISILITLDKKANEETIINYLLQKTEMQIYYSYNNVAIQNASPKLLSLNQLLSEYINHIKDVKNKTLQFDLASSKARLEIVLGFLKVAEITDEVIAVIRKSENSKAGVIQNLIEHFAFTLNQATAIAELRLYKLSKTDKEAFLLEKEKLENEIKHIEILLSDENEFNLWLISILQDIKKKFSRPRKTEIVEENLKISYDETDLVEDEKIFLSVSKFGYIKRTSTKIEDSNSFKTFALKEEDKLVFWDRVSTLHHMLLFTNLGNYLLLPIYKITESKWKEFGTHASDFVELASGEEIVSAICVTDFNILNYVCLFTKQGQGKRVILKDFEVSRANKTFTAIKLRNDDELIGAKLSNGYKDVLLVTAKGNASLYTENDVQIYGTKSNGTKSCYLPPNDEIRAFALVEQGETIAMLANEKYVKRMNVSSIQKSNKKNLGKQLFLQQKTKPWIVDDVAVTNLNDYIYFKMEDQNLEFERIVEYPITKSNEGFSKIKIDGVQLSFFKNNEKTKEVLDEEKPVSESQIDNIEAADEEPIQTKPIKYVESTKKEEDIFSNAEKQVDVLDLDVDEILKKFNIK